jgi:hypothetical protein
VPALQRPMKEALDREEKAKHIPLAFCYSAVACSS